MKSQLMIVCFYSSNYT